MTSVIIDDTVPHTQVIATSLQTQFDTDWFADAASNVVVYARASAAVPNDVTQLVSSSDYNVTFVGAEQFVRVTFLVGRTVGDIVTITRNTPEARENLYVNTNFTPSMLNGDFGRLVLMLQERQLSDTQLTPRYNNSATLEPVLDIILPLLTAKQSWRKNVGNTAFEGFQALNEADIADMTFIVQTPNALIPAAQALSVLTTGILKSTTTTGVVTISPSLSSLDVAGIGENQIAYGDGPNSYALTTLTPFARTLIDDIDALTARATLGLSIGSQVQAYNVKLQSISDVVFGADTIAYFNSDSSVLSTPLTAYARSLIDDASAAAARVTLGLVIGTDVQAWSPTLESMSPLGTGADVFLYTTAANTWAESTVTAFARTLLDDSDATAMRTTLGVDASGTAFQIVNNLSEGDPAIMRTNLGLVIGTNVQAYDATLQSISALGTAADRMLYTTGVDVWAETGLSSFMRTVLDDTSAADAAVTLEVLPLTGGTMTGPLILYGDPVLGSEAATRSYVDNRLENFEEACIVMADDLTGYIYDNGVAGVGATLTAPGNGVFEADDIQPALTNRVLVNLSVNQEYNGAYTVTTSSAGAPAVLTRATDYDTPADMQAGDNFSVVQGTVWGASQWVMSQVNPITIGTTIITFSQLAGQGALLRANNLSDLTSVVTAQTNLLLLPGTNVQAYDATLQSISNLGTAADRIAYTTGVDVWAETVLTSYARSLIDDIDAAAAQSTLGLVIGTNVQAYSGNLAVAASPANSATLISTSTGVAVWSGSMTDGQVIIGFTSGTPVRGNITAGANIVVTNGPGAITISSTASSTVADSMLLMGG